MRGLAAGTADLIDARAACGEMSRSDPYNKHAEENLHDLTGKLRDFNVREARVFDGGGVTRTRCTSRRMRAPG